MKKRKRRPKGAAASKCQASHRLMLRKIVAMIETAGLQIGARDRDFGNGGLRQNLGGDIVDRGVGDFMNEADVLVFAGDDARDDFAPGDLGIDNGLAPAPSIVDHHNEILHGGSPRPRKAGVAVCSQLFLKIRNKSSHKFVKSEKEAATAVTPPAACENHAARAHFEPPFISLW